MGTIEIIVRVFLLGVLIACLIASILGIRYANKCIRESEEREQELRDDADFWADHIRNIFR